MVFSKFIKRIANRHPPANDPVTVIDPSILVNATAPENIKVSDWATKIEEVTAQCADDITRYRDAAETVLLWSSAYRERATEYEQLKAEKGESDDKTVRAYEARELAYRALRQASRDLTYQQKREIVQSTHNVADRLAHAFAPELAACCEELFPLEFRNKMREAGKTSDGDKQQHILDLLHLEPQNFTKNDRLTPALHELWGEMITRPESPRQAILVLSNELKTLQKRGNTGDRVTFIKNRLRQEQIKHRHMPDIHAAIEQILGKIEGVELASKDQISPELSTSSGSVPPQGVASATSRTSVPATSVTIVSTHGESCTPGAQNSR